MCPSSHSEGKSFAQLAGREALLKSGPQLASNEVKVVLPDRIQAGIDEEGPRLPGVSRRPRQETTSEAVREVQ